MRQTTPIDCHHNHGPLIITPLYDEPVVFRRNYGATGNPVRPKGMTQENSEKNMPEKRPDGKQVKNFEDQYRKPSGRNMS